MTTKHSSPGFGRMLLTLSLLLTACASSSPVYLAAKPPAVPPLPASARQPTMPLGWSSFSADARDDLQMWRLSLTPPASPVGSASSPMTH